MHCGGAGGGWRCGRLRARGHARGCACVRQMLIPAASTNVLEAPNALHYSISPRASSPFRGVLSVSCGLSKMLSALLVLGNTAFHTKRFDAQATECLVIA